MRILPVNNYQTNNKTNANFGMLKVIDAKPEEMQKVIRMVQTIKGGGYKPFRVIDALNPQYTPNPGKNEGGFYFGDSLEQSKIPTYQKEGQNILIFDEELKLGNGPHKIWGFSIDQNFDKAFNNPVVITMEQLRTKYLAVKKSIDKILANEKRLETMKDALAKTRIEEAKDFGLA